MSERAIIKERLRKKEIEIQSLEEKLRSARVYVQALHDIVKMLDKSVSEDVPVESILRPGSTVSQARDVIIKVGRPVHVNELLEALGKEATREGRASLTSQLAAYVRREEIFTRPAPNTFGLIELGHESLEDDQGAGPPTGFGKTPQDDDDEEIPF
jgi:hypothetical protein